MTRSRGKPAQEQTSYATARVDEMPSACAYRWRECVDSSTRDFLRAKEEGGEVPVYSDRSFS